MSVELTSVFSGTVIDIHDRIDKTGGDNQALILAT